MLSNLINLFKPAPLLPAIQDADEVDRQYRYWRFRITYSLIIGYAVFYLTRKTFTYAMPYIAMDLGFSKVELGALGSILYLTYGVSKFVSGAMSDGANPRYFMAIGLILVGLCNIAFGMSSSFWLFALFWGLNGWFQAWGWPPCCKSLTYWFNRTERGLRYSICNTACNIGGALIPVMTVFLALTFGWRWAMFIPATVSILMGLVIMNRLRDVPESLGLPPIEQQDKTKAEKQSVSGTLSISEIMFKHVLTNKFVWLFAVVNFFVYFVRAAISDWSILYLMEARAFNDVLAAQAPFWFEVTGIFGMLTAGFVSDYFYRGNRVPVIIFCGIGMLGAIFGLWYTPAHLVYLDFIFYALLGFCVFGPQMIVGLAASECVDKRAASSANGFAGTLGYIGAASAGMPVGYSVETWGWVGYFAAMIVSATLIFICLLPFWSNKNTFQRKMVAV